MLLLALVLPKNSLAASRKAMFRYRRDSKYTIIITIILITI